jgi:3-dehydroquinate synthase
LRSRFLKKNRTKIHFYDSVPAAKKFAPSQSLLIYDKVLLKNSSFRKFKKFFKQSYAVQSGEGLKSLSKFSYHVEKILEMTSQLQKPIRIVAAGGGSVGDFSGFLASTIKRGVDLVHVPTTWLAAIDSAHGGKTALNVKGYKNQIGSFHPAKEIFLIKSFLQSQNQKQIDDALGEVLKVSMLAGGRLFKKTSQLEAWGPDDLWKLLPELIKAKYAIVDKDPLEKIGIRHLLNLGHTVGHLVETQAKMSHGTAVMYGLGFSLQWSLKEKILQNQKNYFWRNSFLYSQIPNGPKLAKVLKRLKNSKKYLSQDKKMTGSNKVRFIFLIAPGKPKIKSVDVRSIEKEIQRQSHVI